ncbi:MAG TPA: alpha/beta fold hydrolase [Actinomycetes bacterium]|nr:alpha/beta fold hydrolase [Actinomycetes bacterium]
MTSGTGVKPERHTSELDLFRLYLDQAGRHPLLTRQDEIKLSRAYRQGLGARQKLATLAADDPRRPGLEAQADRDESARRTTIESNLRLVVAVARRFTATGLPLGDLVQEENLGLVRAVERFDWRLGFKFSTYATWWIRQAIARGAADRGARAIRVPLHVDDQVGRLWRAQARLYELLGREPSDEAPAGELDMPVEKVQRLKDAAQAITSLVAPIGDDGAALQDFLEDERAVGPDEPAAETIGRKALEKALATLPPRQRQALTLRFGLDSGSSRTLEEVGALVGVSREHARQLERAALLTRDGFDVWVYDQVGTGRSSRLGDPRGYSIARNVADLEAMRQRIGADRMILLGHSWGGQVAAGGLVRGRLTSRQQLGVYRLLARPRMLLAWTLLQVDPPAARAFAADAEMDARNDRVCNAGRAGAHCHGLPPGPALYGLGFYAWQFPQSAAARPWADPRPALARLQTPALVLKGSCDHLSWATGVDYRQALPNARLVSQHHAGHNAYQDQPALFSAVVRAFLAGRSLLVLPWMGSDVPADYEAWGVGGAGWRVQREVRVKPSSSPRRGHEALNRRRRHAIVVRNRMWTLT